MSTCRPDGDSKASCVTLREASVLNSPGAGEWPEPQQISALDSDMTMGILGS
jgi:hypothetical protein